MASLAQLLADHGNLLVLDAASTRVQVGLLRRDLEPIWRDSSDEAGKAVFALSQDCLSAAGLQFSDVHAFAFCSGPGSMLGVRTVAMALRTWQRLAPRPAYEFDSLDLIALGLLGRGVERPFSVIADARRDTWHVRSVNAAGEIAPLQRCATSSLAGTAEALWQPNALRSWSPPPRATHEVAYEIPALFAAHSQADLFHLTASPDAFQHEAPEYKKWSAQVHSAANATK